MSPRILVTVSRTWTDISTMREVLVRPSCYGGALMPQRIQRKREAGWRMPDGAVYVGRPTKWGNPYRWSDYPRYRTTVDIDGEWSANRRSDETLRFFAMTDFENQYLRIDGPHSDAPSPEEIRRELGGKDLACWCPEGQPCHADVLLRIANEVLSDHAETCEVTQ